MLKPFGTGKNVGMPFCKIGNLVLTKETRRCVVCGGHCACFGGWGVRR